MSDLEQLKEKANLALGDVRFVEIVRDAPLTSENQVNLSYIDREAFKYALESSGSTQRAQELAKSARALGEIRRDFAEEFAALAETAFKKTRERNVREKQVKPEAVERKKLFSEMRFFFPNSYMGSTYADDVAMVEVIFCDRLSTSIKFTSSFGSEYTAHRAGRKFCMEILNALIKTAPGGTGLLKDLTQLLEEKFGMKVAPADSVVNTATVFEVDGVKYHRHPNGGGLVAETAHVAETAYVGPFALVKDRAKVLDKARIEDRAVISGNAVVKDEARVSGSARVSDSARVFGSAQVSDSALVSGSAQVFGSALVYGSAWVFGSAQVYGSVRVYGSARVHGSALVSGLAVLREGCYSIEVINK